MVRTSDTTLAQPTAGVAAIRRLIAPPTCGHLLAEGHGVASVAAGAGADRAVVHHLALGVDAASTGASVDALLGDAHLADGAVLVDLALWLAAERAGRVTDQSWLAGAAVLSTRSGGADGVRAAGVRLARVERPAPSHRIASVARQTRALRPAVDHIAPGVNSAVAGPALGHHQRLAALVRVADRALRTVAGRVA